MANVLFLDNALAHFMFWVHNNRKTADKINALLNDIERNGAAKGIGKPERLKHEPGWSRRIDKENRLVYEVRENFIEVKSCKGHYED